MYTVQEGQYGIYYVTASDGTQIVGYDIKIKADIKCDELNEKYKG